LPSRARSPNTSAGALFVPWRNFSRFHNVPMKHRFRSATDPVEFGVKMNPMLKLPKVFRAPNLTELAYLSVKQHLLNGKLVEGSRLTEEALSSQLGISKSPVREALTRLESEGLIVIESRRGAYVRKFSIRETRDLYNVRELLEVHAVGIARLSPGLLRDLAESIERTRYHLEHGDMIAHVEEDIRFHSMIAAATENEELCRILENVQHKSLLSRAKTYHLSATTAPVSHQKIYRALKAGDRAAAQQAMSEHIAFVRDTLLESLQFADAAVAEMEAATVGAGF
jgi:DNA-binding GntR family transcriptional regulator